MSSLPPPTIHTHTHRRPAILPVALLMSILLSIHIIDDILHLTTSSPVVSILSLSVWFIYPWVIYMALSIDSDWWQGMHPTSHSWALIGSGNLNEPLLESSWGTLLRSSSSTLASMVSDLEVNDHAGNSSMMCPVVVPFGQIRLRTDIKFRSGR